MALERAELDLSYFRDYSGYADIIDAVNSLANATEAQFQEIKREKWYQRLFDTVIFRRNGLIRMGNQISTLAQAQGILRQLIVRLSETDSEISKIVSTHADSIDQLAQQDVFFAEKVYRLENRFWGIQTEEQANVPGDLLYESLRHAMRVNPDDATELQQDYSNIVLQKVEHESIISDLEPVLAEEDEKVRKQLLRYVLEYMYLHTSSFDFTDKQNEYIDCFLLHSRLISNMKDQILNEAKLRGAKGLVDKYRFSGLEEEQEEHNDALLFEITDEPNEATAPVQEEAQEVAFDVDDLSAWGNMTKLELSSHFEDYRAAVERGSVNAQFMLGMCYAFGAGTEENEVEAFRWISKAAESGLAEAQETLGRYYHYDLSNITGKNEDLAIEWYTKAAEQGYSRANRQLGELYFKKAKQALEENDLSACENYQRLSYSWYLKAAERGDPASQYKVGTYLEIGYGVAENPDGATKRFREAASQNEYYAQLEMGDRYEHGKTVIKNIELAFQYYEWAAKGIRSGKIQLGRCYMFGLGTKKDLHKAEEVLADACKGTYSVDELENKAHFPEAHFLLAQTLYALNVRDHLGEPEFLDYLAVLAGFVIGHTVNKGVKVSKEMKRLSEFLATNDGKKMLNHYKSAALDGHKEAGKAEEAINRLLAGKPNLIDVFKK